MKRIKHDGFKTSLYKIQYNPFSFDSWVDVYETSDTHKLYDMYTYLKSKHENEAFRCLILFGNTYREILI